MNIAFKKKFELLWKRYFDDAELPITFFYADDESHVDLVKPGSVERCIIGALAEARKGRSMRFDVKSIGCSGGKRYIGFSEKGPPDLEYFLSCGIPGKLEGERYKKSPELVKEWMNYQSGFKAPAKYIIIKRWDKLDESDDPAVVVFFAPPDVISGLFTLANFDESEPNGVFTPMGSGCGVVFQRPYLELNSKRPRAVMGMFDVSARPYVEQDVLTFSVPINKFVRMVDNMDESFLITDSWKEVLPRISSRKKK